MTIRIALILAACLVLVGVLVYEAPAETTTAPVAGLDGGFERGVLLVEADDGTQHEFDIYLAVTFEQKQRGLMFVRNLPERTGMLFIYDEDGIRSMWMKNTYISLDLVFIRADGTVASVIREAQPLSLQSLSSAEPVRYVLELNAGVTRRFDIGRGSKISWEFVTDDSPGFGPSGPRRRAAVYFPPASHSLATNRAFFRSELLSGY